MHACSLVHVLPPGRACEPETPSSRLQLWGRKNIDLTCLSASWVFLSQILGWLRELNQHELCGRIILLHRRPSNPKITGLRQNLTSPMGAGAVVVTSTVKPCISFLNLTYWLCKPLLKNRPKKKRGHKKLTMKRPEINDRWKEGVVAVRCYHVRKGGSERGLLRQRLAEHRSEAADNNGKYIEATGAIELVERKVETKRQKRYT